MKTCKTKNLKLMGLGVLLAVLQPIASANAEIFSYSFSAIGPDSATVSGTFGYTTNLVDSSPDDLSRGTYSQSGFLTARIRGGINDGFTIVSSGLDWTVNDGVEDYLAIIGQLNINLTDTSANVFNDDSLPTELTLEDFDERELVLQDVFYEFTSLTRVSDSSQEITGQYFINDNEKNIVVISKLSETEYRIESPGVWQGIGIFDGTTYFGSFRYYDAIQEPFNGVIGEHFGVLEDDGSFSVHGINRTKIGGEFDITWNKANSIELNNFSGAAVIKQNLDIFVPSTLYQDTDSILDVWLNLEFTPSDDSDFLWKLKDYGAN